MSYTLSQLKIFAAVIEASSITVASEQLSLTQPAVSIQLKNFQKQFDEPLYEIINQRFQATEFGMDVYRHSQLILEEVSFFNQRLRWPKDTLVGKIKFSVVSTGKYIAPFLMSRFAQSEPGISWQLDVSNKTQVITALEQNKVDLTLMSILPNNLEIDYLPLMPNRLFLVAGKNAQIISETIKTPEFLQEIPLIMREKGSGTRTMMEEFIVKQGLKVHAPFELASNEAVKQAVIAGLGYSIMPLIGIKKELERKDLHIIPMKGLPLETSWYVVWLKQKKLGAASNAFLDFLKLHAHNSEDFFFN
jgi:DNA-binding transcriptional LysR family regulator